MVTKLADIHLDDDEFLLFERMRGAETRKNRYFHEFDGVSTQFDVYLGELRGLTTAKAEFTTARSMSEYEPPPFMIFEVTGDPFFESRRLAEATFADVEAEIARRSEEHTSELQSH